MTGVRLETERLILRWFTLDDLEEYYPLGADPKIMRYLGEPFASVESARETLISAPLKDYASYGYGRFACIWKQTGRMVGFCGPKYLPDVDEVDLGYRFLPDYWGKGLATESARATIEYARSELGLRRLVAWVHPENVASARVVTKLGFSFERHMSVPDIPGIDFERYVKVLDSGET